MQGSLRGPGGEPGGTDGGKWQTGPCSHPKTRGIPNSRQALDTIREKTEVDFSPSFQSWLFLPAEQFFTDVLCYCRLAMGGYRFPQVCSLGGPSTHLCPTQNQCTARLPWLYLFTHPFTVPTSLHVP